MTKRSAAKLLRADKRLPKSLPDHAIWQGDVEQLLNKLPRTSKFDFVLTSPPYNLGKEYEKKQTFRKYLRWQADVIEGVVGALRKGGSLCWQVGNYVENGFIEPLDIHLHPLFAELGLTLRNRIVWHYGHGLHCKRRFSGRYEVVLWYTKGDDYVFNLDSVRVPSKYPGKRGRNGNISSNPLGKNPEDVWAIPNVKANHKEKTLHPCQFPVGLAERLILALTKRGERVCDPFCGVASSGVAAALHERKFFGVEINSRYCKVGLRRINDALEGTSKYRPHDQEIYDHTRSVLSRHPGGNP